MEKTDANFKELMKAYQPEKAPGNFTLEVMNRIYAESSQISEYKPVLNKWFLWVVGVLIGGYVMLSMFSAGTDQAASGKSKFFGWLPQLDWSGAAEAGEKVTGVLGGLPQYMVVIFLSATFLLLLDQWILKRKKAD